MSPDEIKSLRQTLGTTHKVLAELLHIDPGLVRDWERGEQFPTKAHVEAMEALRENPPPRPARGDATPMELLADPKFFLLVRKLLAHRVLRAEVERLALEYPDPLDPEGAGAGAGAGAARKGKR